jgi:hypothetical protein
MKGDVEIVLNQLQKKRQFFPKIREIDPKERRSKFRLIIGSFITSRGQDQASE